MPVKKTITKEAVLNSAIEVLRKHGEEGLNARAIASYMEISTQPIYSLFGNMEETYRQLTKEAEKRYYAWQKEYLSKNLVSDYKAYGMAFIRFSAEEKQLFKFIFMRSKDNLHASEPQKTQDVVVEIICKTYGVDVATAKKFHNLMSVFCFGLATLINCGVVKYDEEEVSKSLTEQFNALSGLYLKK